MVDQREVADLVADRPDLREGVEAILAVDEDRDVWTFEDVPVETGVFGEIVAAGVVESVDDGYRVADPETVRAALADDGGDGQPSDATGVDLDAVTQLSGSGTALLSGATAAVVALFVAARTLAAGAVFRNGTVVLLGNDPYFYRYWVDGLLARSPSPLALGTLADLSVAGVGGGEPLFVATLWWVSALLGGSREVAGLVLAWYPVVGALVVGALVYAVGAHLLGDRRVGAVAAALLAVMPAHAMRTAVGFADHHAFDYAWLMATIAALVWLATVDDPTGRVARRGALALGVAVAGLTLSWEGAPLLLLAVAACLAAAALLDVADERSPLRANAPVLAGLGGGGLVALVAHVALGWMSPVATAAPALLAAGGLAVVGGGELLARRGAGVKRTAAAEVAVPVVGVVVLALAAPGVLGRLVDRFGFVLLTAGIAETGSAFAPGRLGGVKFFGGVVVLALPVLVWAGRRAVLGDRRWLVLSVFTWYLLVLSAIQLRFVGQLAPLVALFAAVGFVWGLARLDLTSLPVPVREPAPQVDERTSVPHDEERTGPRDDPGEWFDAADVTLRSGVVAVVLVAAVVGPAVYFLPEQVSGSALADRNYETARWMAEYADERGWTYPENYVLSRWGINRPLNYFANGIAANYTYARNTYPEFVSVSDPDPLYDRLKGRVGFIVLEPLPPRADTAQQHLYNTYGSRWVTPEGEVRYEAVEHYRAVYTTEGGANKVFVPVPGARVVGTAPPNATVTLRTTVEIPNDQFTYRTVTTANASGRYRVVVPYAGEYTVRANNETRTVTVPLDAVRNGTRVEVGR